MELVSRHILVHYNEIALKGKNRGFFEKLLVESLYVAFRGLEVQDIRRLSGRILAEFEKEYSYQEIAERLHEVIGISHFELTEKVDQNLEAIQSSIGSFIQDKDVESFAIYTRRSNKDFPMNSVETNRALGSFVVNEKGWKVSIDAPELPIYVYLVGDAAYIAYHRDVGSGGMPYGTAGPVGILLSGGIDSPVAAYRMIRRGTSPIFIHFHSAPYTDQASQDKVVDLAKHLMRYKRSAPLYLVPFADLQRKIVQETKASYRVILYRRFMMRTAEAIAKKHGGKALVTGEALGQVASQTLENLATIDSVTQMPILRPLIGHDKLDIVREAEKIGTYETSIEPHDDCCSYLMPQQPATKSRNEQLEEAEQVFDIDQEVQALIEKSERIKVGTPPREKKKD